ncbi:unnamed protein product [Protopolystoma xenopodis]|uniref:Uncharacterized protein n=1 Tax=Protopolystoma xenopodis TaxID=117903 RepID=A0A448X841_9PLAT|nr:unnamed protein product [Protopolystoma xenopodis]
MEDGARALMIFESAQFVTYLASPYLYPTASIRIHQLSDGRFCGSKRTSCPFSNTSCLQSFREVPACLNNLISSTYENQTYSGLNASNGGFSNLSVASSQVQQHQKSSFATNFVIGAGVVASVNQTAAAGSVYYTAPAQVSRSSNLRRGSTARRHLSPVQLQCVGSCLVPEAAKLRADLMTGPAAYVLHWDTESLIGEK